MVTESKYANRVWNGSESLDEYLTALTSLANKLNRPYAQVMLKFVQGLPRDYQDFVLSTDTHELSTYMTRARLFHARKQVELNPTSSTNQNNTIAAVEDIKDSLNQLKLQINAINQFRDRSDDYRQRRRSHSRDEFRPKRHFSRDRQERSSSREKYHSRRSSSWENIIPVDHPAGINIIPVGIIHLIDHAQWAVIGVQKRDTPHTDPIVGTAALAAALNERSALTRINVSSATNVATMAICKRPVSWVLSRMKTQTRQSWRSWDPTAGQ